MNITYITCMDDGTNEHLRNVIHRPKFMNDWGTGLVWALSTIGNSCMSLSNFVQMALVFSFILLSQREIIVMAWKLTFEMNHRTFLNEHKSDIVQNLRNISDSIAFPVHIPSAKRDRISMWGPFQDFSIQIDPRLVKINVEVVQKQRMKASVFFLTEQHKFWSNKCHSEWQYILISVVYFPWRWMNSVTNSI